MLLMIANMVIALAVLAGVVAAAYLLGEREWWD